MPRYFFHIREEEQVIVDDEGIDLPNLEAAREEAVAAARQLLSQSVLKGKACNGRVFEITNENGIVVLSVPFRETIEHWSLQATR